MNDKPHPEMGYRSCLGIIRLAGQYSPARMEAAAERSLVTGACRYQSVSGAEYFDWRTQRCSNNR